MTDSRAKERALSQTDYSKYDFSYSTKNYETIFDKGLSEDVVRRISELKSEPQWMLEFRLKALKAFREKAMPKWGADLGEINFDEIIYYMKASGENKKSWDEVPAEVKKTFERLGIPEAERKFLAGVGAQYDSEVMYHSIREDLEKLGVVFLSMDEGLKQYPEIVKEHFGKVIPLNDNKFASLNSAVWSGGSFVYVPKNVKVDIPLQAYFRINAESFGQFERTLIIADEGSQIHYVEGCFTAGTQIRTENGVKPIEGIEKGEKVLTHKGQHKEVYFTQVRPYDGKLYRINVYGDTTSTIEATEEHPFFIAKRERINERNRSFKPEWVAAKSLHAGDYACYPINKKIISNPYHEFEISLGGNKGQYVKTKEAIKSDASFFRLAGYFLAEGSTDRGFYTHFSFNVNEQGYIADTKTLLKNALGVEKVYEPIHEKNNGHSVVVSSAKITRIFEHFGKGSLGKTIPEWMMLEAPEKQAELIKGLFNGDGSYMLEKYKWGTKEMFRINTVSKTLAMQAREILLRLGIASSINKQERGKPRQTMYAVVIGGEYLEKFGKMVGIEAGKNISGKKRATMFTMDEDYMYAPIKSVEPQEVAGLHVYNFGVREDESYTANGLAVHNCTAPKFSTQSLHSAVVEVIAKEGSHVRYTTVQNWANNIYNLVTKRAFACRNATVEWVDGNLGSKVTMKYPAIYLMGEGAKGEVLSVALAGAGQHQDAGAKVVHLASNTTSKVTSKSISKDGGRTSYRGLVKVLKGCKNVKSNVMCDALLLDKDSRTDTYPYVEIDEPTATIAHEAKVGKIGEDQIFYLTSKGLTEAEALAMIVLGFMQPFTKTLPLEYAVELNRLIEMEMENSVG